MPAILSAYTGSVGIALSPSGDTTGAADSAAITSAVAKLPAKGGTITLNPSSPWYLKAGGVSVTVAGVWINAPGTFINGVGTGDLIRMQSSDNTFAIKGGGVIGFPTFEGTSMGAGSCAVHLGDILQAQCDVFVQNFTGSGGIGVHFDNANFWTEQLRTRVYAQNCTQGVVFDVSGALTSTQSYARASADIYINQTTATNDGVVLQNGALIYDGDIRFRGNFTGQAGALTSAALRLTGTVPAGHPGAGAFSQILDSRVEIGIECAGGFAHTPNTITAGSVGNNTIFNCYGIMDFNNNFAVSGSSSTIYPFNGFVTGDSVLATVAGYPNAFTWNIGGGIALGDFAAAHSISNGSTLSVTNHGLYRVTETGAVTGIIMQAGTFDGQTVVVINTAAFTVTFAAAGTSHVQGGVAVVIPANGSVLFTWDNVTTSLWYPVIGP